MSFWESIEGKTGCDDILEEIKRELYAWEPEVTLSKFEDK
jgi:hypothetical protein